MSASGAPPYLATLLVPIRESGALLPQVLYLKYLQNTSARHLAWRLGMFLQLASSILILYAGLFMQALAAGLVIIISLAVASLSRALCSLTNKDIQGKHLKEGNRGKLIGSASSISALITVVISGLSLLSISSPYTHEGLLQCLGAYLSHPKLFVLGGLAVLAQAFCLFVMWPLKTNVSVLSDSVTIDNAESDDAQKSRLKNHATLIKFIIVRSLLSHSALIAPLFVLAYTGDVVSILAYLIVAQALASLVSAYIWGALSDKSALLCMQIGTILSLMASMSLSYLLFFNTHLLANMYYIIGLFFLLSIGHAGIRTGRKIYALDIAQGHDRTEFVAISNSAVGSFILVAGAAYSVLMVIETNITVLIMTLGLALGMLLSLLVKKEK